MNAIAPLTIKLFRDKNEGKRYSKAPFDTLGERKEAYMHPKSAEEVFVRMPDSLSEVTKGNNVSNECSAAPSGNEKRRKRFPRVQTALSRSKKGRKCYRRDSEQAQSA